MNTDFQKVGHNGSSGMSAYGHYRGVADQHEVGVTSLRSRACDVMEPNYWCEYTSDHAPSWQPRSFVLLTLAWLCQDLPSQRSGTNSSRAVLDNTPPFYQMNCFIPATWEVLSSNQDLANRTVVWASPSKFWLVCFIGNSKIGSINSSSSSSVSQRG